MLRPNQISDDFILQKFDAKPFEERINDFWLNFIHAYREYVNTELEEWYKKFPSYFPYMKKLQWVAVFNNQDIAFYIFESELDGITTEIHQYETYGDLKESRKPQNKKETHLTKLFEEHKTYSRFEISYGFKDQFTMEVSNDPSDLAEMGRLKGRIMAMNHGYKLKQEKEERFSLFDLEQYVLKVEDDHFEYEIGEAIKAYRQNLFLAATAVAGVALENILILIIKKNNLSSKTKGPYIKDYLNVLVDHHLLDDRKRREIMNFNNTRNGAAHSNSGVAMASHAEEGFAVLKYLIQKFY